MPHAGYGAFAEKALTDLIAKITALRPKTRRAMVAIVGAPGSGKSTLAQDLAAQIPAAAVVPMDGFHLDNAVLEARGLRPRKGAPETFDAAGFVALTRRLCTEAEVAIPRFDRARDLSIAGAEIIGPSHKILLVEGNYLLLDAAPWRDLAPIWDLTIWLEVPLPDLQKRLTQRWRDLGASTTAAHARVLANDIPNARLVCEGSRPADVILQSC